ncbi:MAG: hypothetical protein DHS20C15_13750 [Planctomycetota bacterium]|nr:MAG: hypothetical protein DHS20C15_13750 [Planctomycetota bacterium]
MSARLLAPLAMVAAVGVAVFVLLTDDGRAAANDLGAARRPAHEDAPVPRSERGARLPSSVRESAGSSARLSAMETLDAPRVVGHFGPAVPNGGRTARLTGTISVDGAPSAAVLRFTHGLNRGAELVLAGDGSLDWSELYPGRGRIEVSVGESGPRCEREVLLRHRGARALELDLGEHGVVHGVVRDAAGAPVIGAELALDGRLIRSDTEGRFVLPRGAAGVADFSARAAGFASYTEQLTEGVGVSRFEPFEVELHAGIDLALELGAVPPGTHDEVLVWLLPTAGERLSGSPPRSATPWHERFPLRLRVGAVHHIPDLPEGRVDVLAFHPLASGGEFVWLTQPLDGTRAPIPLRVELQPVPVMGVTVQRDGAPVPGARVQMAASNRLAGTLQVFGVTDTSLLNSQSLEILPAAQQFTRTSVEGRALLGLHPALRESLFVTVSTSDGELSVTRELERGELEWEVDLAQPGAKVVAR